MFTLPVDVAWEDLDSGMISRLFVRHPHLGLQAAQLARRVLVFHRGSGVAQTTSFFLEEKLDMLIDLTLTAAFRRLYTLLLHAVCPAAAERAALAAADVCAERDESAHARDQPSPHRPPKPKPRHVPSVMSLVTRWTTAPSASI